MAIQVPESALKFGFINDPAGAHVTRTLMLAELRQLLAVCQPDATERQYRVAVVVENVLLKPTETTRVTSFRILRQLYALRPAVILFRALRDLWDDDADAQPLLAALCACGRDPILRATVDLIVDLPVGETITPAQLAAAVKEHLPDRYNLTTLRAAGQNVASSGVTITFGKNCTLRNYVG